MLAQRIYDRSPVAVQNLMISAVGYGNNRTRYGREYWAHRAWLQGFDTWTLEQKQRYQAAELASFVKRAAHASEFYRELYAGYDLDGIRSVADLAALPVVDKEMLRANMDSVYTVPSRGAVEGRTGGTTGKSLVVRVAPSDMMRRMALLDHFKHRIGFEHRRMRRATFNGKHIVPPGGDPSSFWRYNAACKQLIFSTFHLTDTTMFAYVDALDRFAPQALDGIFTPMVELASFIERKGIELSCRPTAIFPTSETVTQVGRDILERVFGAKAYDQYASSEGAPFVTECVAGRLHVELSSGVFEETDGGEVLVTSFTTTGTPLIRYRIGDSMTFSDATTCPCGVESLMVSAIAGRSDDFLYRADGAKITAGNAANLFRNMSNSLIRAQLHQDRMDEVRILLEVDPERYGPVDDEVLRDEFIHKFGVGTRLVIEHVPVIPREVSGKYRLVKNTVRGAS